MVFGEPRSKEPPAKLSPLDERLSKVRARYLKDARRDFENRLQRSIHNARFIDLGIQDDPAAIRPALGYHDPDAKTSYATIDAAFRESDHRLLILGSPGSGESTALLHLARELLEEADADPVTPIPFLLNLSRFRLIGAGSAEGRGRWMGRSAGRSNAAEQRNTRFEDWVFAEMSDFPGLSRDLARRWTSEGRVAVLLDGLDEFNDERRADLAVLLNRTFLLDYPDLCVVVCSRTNEYQALRENEQARLRLRKGIQLEPLNDDQIESYLKAARAEALLKALPRDEALRELAHTPLTLSMLVLAYGGLPPDDLATGTLSERRHRLFGSYVERMLQRQARRERNVPFDDSRANDVPVALYAYRPEQVERWLGWLALVLSTRMRTTFSFPGFFGILRGGIVPGRQSLNFCVVFLALGLFMAATLLAGLSPVPGHDLGAWMFALCGLTLGAMVVPAASASAVIERWQVAFGFGVAAVVLFDFSAGANALSAAVSGAIAPEPMSVVLLAGIVAFFLAGLAADDEDEAKAPALILVAAIAVAVVLHFRAPGWQLPGRRGWQLASVMAAGLFFAILEFLKEDEEVSWLAKLGIALGGLAFAALLALNSEFVAAVGWMTTTITAIATPLVILAAVDSAYSAGVVAVFSIFTFAGGVWKGSAGTIAGDLSYGFLCLTLVILTDHPKFTPLWFDAAIDRMMHSLGGLAEGLNRAVTSPLAWGLIATARRFPWRNRRASEHPSACRGSDGTDAHFFSFSGAVLRRVGGHP